MKISTLQNQNIKACVIFDYRGYQISVSNIDRNTFVFLNRESSKPLFQSTIAIEGVILAKNFIDNLLDK